MISHVTRFSLGLLAILALGTGLLLSTGNASAAKKTSKERVALSAYTAWLTVEVAPITDTTRSQYSASLKNIYTAAQSKERGLHSIRSRQAQRTLSKRKKLAAKRMLGKSTAQKKSALSRKKIASAKFKLNKKHRALSKRTSRQLRSKLNSNLRANKRIYARGLVAIVAMPSSGTGGGVTDTGGGGGGTDTCGGGTDTGGGGGGGGTDTGGGGGGGGTDTGAEPSTPAGQQQSYSSHTLGFETVVGIDSLTIGSGGAINGAIGTNGALQIGGSSTICGQLRMGSSTVSPLGSIPARPYDNGSGGGLCSSGSIVRGDVSPKDVVLPPDVLTNNSNNRLSSIDPVDSSVWQRGNVDWNPVTRELTVKYASLTLTGAAPYLLCKLTIQGGATLNINTPSRARVFFDDPANCSNQSTQISVSGGGRILNQSAAVPGFFLRGSAATPTSASFHGNAIVDSLVLYGPKTNISFSSGYTYSGAVIAKTLSLDGGGTVGNNFSSLTYPLPTQ